MSTPEINSEDPVVLPAEPERTYDKMKIDFIRYTDAGLMVTLHRVDSDGNMDPTDDEGLVLRFRDFDRELERCLNLDTAWNNILRGLAALYRETRLVEKIARATALGQDTTALEASLASVRAQLGVS